LGKIIPVAQVLFGKCRTDLFRALKTGHLGAVGLDVYEGESAYFFADGSSKIIYDDNFARLLSFYNVFVRYALCTPPQFKAGTK
jgi:lactate dehydrogenase-like 2-hydroxyacid dehydrogenase